MKKFRRTFNFRENFTSFFSDITHISLNLIDLIWARHFEATSARSGHFQPHRQLSLTFAVFSLSHCSLFNLQHLFSKLRKIFTTNNTTQHKTKKKQPKSQQLKKPTTKSRYIVYQFLLPLSLEAEGKTFLFFVKTFFTKKHKFLIKETKRLQFLSSGRKKIVKLYYHLRNSSELDILSQKKSATQSVTISPPSQGLGVWETKCGAVEWTILNALKPRDRDKT